SIKNDGHYFCRAGGNRPDGLNEPVTYYLRFVKTIDALRHRVVSKRKLTAVCSHQTKIGNLDAHLI
ncbi:hypothetical protein FQ006_25365, partial [Escherichia coli]|uniref:hypothetical protein n=1 Tax=Escherichia coli TaxID=562 RepID=UPI00135E47F9